MKKLLLASAAAVAIAAPAQAADLPARVPVRAPPVAVVTYDWAGLYIGGQLGWAWSRSEYTMDVVGVAGEDFRHDRNSWIGGGHIGLQGQWGNWILGIEGTYSATNLDSTVLSVLLPGRRRELSIDAIATIVGKAGIAAGAWLVYVKGGLAIADIDTFGINPATGVTVSTSGWEAGWTVGGGVDYMVSPNWIVGVDVNYYRFGFDRDATASDGTPTRYFNTRSDIFAVTGRVSYKFGGPLVARY